MENVPDPAVVQKRNVGLNGEAQALKAKGVGWRWGEICTIEVGSRRSKQDAERAGGNLELFTDEFALLRGRRFVHLLRLGFVQGGHQKIKEGDRKEEGQRALPPE